MDYFAVHSAVSRRVNLRRPLSRYWIVAGGCTVAWWCYQAGQGELGTIALLWSLSEF